jgi:predicted AAA+ superfamily ATPase
LNLEDDRLFPLQTQDLNDFLDSYYEIYPRKKEEWVYLFFDEIQNAPEWERFIRRIQDHEKCRIVLTGSSSKLLSREIASSLRGRTLSVEVFPLSFPEYLRFRGIAPRPLSSRTQALLKNALADYILWGGFPELVPFTEDLRRRTLQEYLDLIMYRDIMERHGITNTFLLKFLIKYCVTHIATDFSVIKLYHDFRSQGLHLSKNTIYEYMSFMEDAYLLFTVPFFSDSVREGMRNPRKIYSIDNGFKLASDLSRSEDAGRLLENLVFLELRRRFPAIHYFKGKQTVDFCVIHRSLPYLINVCHDLSNPATRRREIAGLSEAMDRLGVHSSLLITSDVEEEQAVEQRRIFILPVWKWLLEPRLPDQAE